MSGQSNHIDGCLTHLACPQSFGYRGVFTEPPRAPVIAHYPDINLGHPGFCEKEFDIGHVDGYVSGL